MKILLLGAKGQLGQTFLSHGGLATHGELRAASRDGMLLSGDRAAVGDLADLVGLLELLDEDRPDVIVNAAAYTAVDKAEAEEPAATRINGEAVAAIGGWAAAHGALVIHYSTDYVFAGDAQSPYTPSSPTGPQGAYGRSKLAGEDSLRASGARHMIFRTSWVYSAVGHNFLRTMLRLGEERDELRVVADQRGTPTSTSLIVEATLTALDAYRAAGGSANELTGTYHLTASGETTWHGFAEAIFSEAVEAGVMMRRPKVHPIQTSDFPTPAKRPAYSVLDNSSFVHTFGQPLMDWRDALRATLRAMSS
ncbi:dTDP-4-dehydrorhamnose reductase [Luteibacter sp. CQ10]|uniref:dTDP-4-dehydrorhamnose reductase n=1 Tax=Luteibacter sp. CQ10 TaxID=2805821 RepID=UPI0034A5506D